MSQVREKNAFDTLITDKIDVKPIFKVFNRTSYKLLKLDYPFLLTMSPKNF